MPYPNTNPFGAGELFANASSGVTSMPISAALAATTRAPTGVSSVAARCRPDVASHGLQLFAAVVRQGAKQLAAAATVDRSRLSNVAGHVTFVDEYCECLLCEHGPMPVGDPLGFDEGRLRPFGDNDKAEPDLGKQTF